MKFVNPPFSEKENSGKNHQESSKKKNIKKVEFRLNFSFKSILVWALIILMGLSLISSFNKPSIKAEEINLSQALNNVKEGKIKQIQVEGDRLVLTYKDDKKAFARKETGESLVKTLETAQIDPKSVDIKIVDQSLTRTIADIAGTFLPLVLMALFFYFIFRQAKGAQENIFSFGQSRAKLFDKGKQSITFADVAGVDEAKNELQEVVDFLKHPQKYQALGARTPKGVLLVGPSGVGKTLLAKALAGEAGVPFFSMAGSEFMEMLVGVGASITRETPVLIRKDGWTKLIPIGEFVDQYYKADEEGMIKEVKGVETLGFEKVKNKFWGTKSIKGEKMVFEKSCFKKVGGVYRHKVNEIYEVEFLDGKIRTTGDHSVFVRTHGWICPKKVADLQEGDLLVGLPMNVRKWDEKQRKTVHQIKKHQFVDNVELSLDVWGDDPEVWEKYEEVVENPQRLFQCQLAEGVGVCQMTVSNWQRGINMPRAVSKKMVKLNLSGEVAVSPELMKLFGFYTAEGRGTNNLEFTFGIHEDDLVLETAELMDEVFNAGKPVLEKTRDNTVRVKYYSAHLGRFFTRHCGNGSHNKHVPNFIWDLPKEFFLSYLEGYAKGDGYISKSGKLCATSVSRQLVRELAWLCSLHGIKAGVKSEFQKGGRKIKNKPLPNLYSWTLIIGKTSNPFWKGEIDFPYQIKRSIVKKVSKSPYEGYVYDLCGVDNEGFFGGEKPILLHNSRVRNLFATAKKAAPSIIFIDEVDAIGRQRGQGFMTGGHDEREQTLNQILVEMDGFTPNDNVMVIAATNRGDLLDPALLRPGRFDRTVVLDMPDLEGRKAILAIHAIGKHFVKGVTWEKIAKRTVGFSGADLENMLNESAILAARLNKKEIEEADIEEAAVKVKLGPERKRLQSDEDKKMTAFHEAGHAVVNYYSPHTDPVHRISIVARGISLGHTLIAPNKDRSHETKTRLLEQVNVMMGGRAAEEMTFKEMTTGASNDIAQATRIARAMVIDFGMSELGPIFLGNQIGEDEGRMFYEPNNLSPEMQSKIDKEVKKITDFAYKSAQDILKKNKGKLDKIADKLIEKETLEEEEFEKLMK